MAAWEAQAVHQLALALAAFAAPHTTPQEDVELLLGQAAGGGPSLLQARTWTGRAAGGWVTNRAPSALLCWRGGATHTARRTHLC